MNEKIYRSMGAVGVCNIVLGAITICMSIATGVLLIISGASLLKRKNGLTI